MPTWKPGRVVAQHAAPLQGRTQGRVEFGEFGFLGDVGGAFEVEAETVGIVEDGVPEAVADLGLGGVDAAGSEVVIDGDGVGAGKPEGDAFADFSGGLPGVVTFGAELLEHQVCAAKGEPAPADGAVGRPLVFHGEAEAVEVEAEGALHVGDVEKGDDLFDVFVDVHARLQRENFQVSELHSTAGFSLRTSRVRRGLG